MHRPDGAWALLGGLMLLSTGFIAAVIVPASVFPLFMAAFGVGKAAASATISGVFLAWALLQLPVGYALDRRENRRLVLLAGGAFLVVGLAALAVETYAVHLLFRLAMGACAALIFVGSLNVLAQVLPAERQALGTSLFLASPPLGIAVAPFGGPRIAASFGWRAAGVAAVGLAAAGLLVVAAVHREPVTTASEVTVAQYLAAVRDPDVLLVSTMALCSYAVWTYLTTWMPTYGTEVVGVDLATAGAAAALVPLAGLLARPGGGWVADRLGGRLRPVVAASFVATAALLLALGEARSPAAFAAVLALLGASVNLAVGLYFVYVARLADPATTATSLSVLAGLSQVGNLVAPAAGGWVIEAVSWSASLWVAAGVAVAGLVALALVPGPTG